MGTEKEGFLGLICQLRSGFSERHIPKGIRGRRIEQDTNCPSLASTCKQGYSPPCAHIPHTYINIQTSTYTHSYIYKQVCAFVPEGKTLPRMISSSMMLASECHSICLSLSAELADSGCMQPSGRTAFGKLFWLSKNQNTKNYEGPTEA